MLVVALAWIYVVLLVAVVEAMSPHGTLLGAIFTFVFYGVLPLSIVLSWFEQKAVAVFLTLLSLGVKNIRLGPTMAAFLTPNLIDVLVEKFGVQTISTPEADIAASLKLAA